MAHKQPKRGEIILERFLGGRFGICCRVGESIDLPAILQVVQDALDALYTVRGVIPDHWTRTIKVEEIPGHSRQTDKAFLAIANVLTERKQELGINNMRYS